MGEWVNPEPFMEEFGKALREAYRRYPAETVAWFRTVCGTGPWGHALRLEVRDDTELQVNGETFDDFDGYGSGECRSGLAPGDEVTVGNTYIQVGRALDPHLMEAVWTLSVSEGSGDNFPVPARRIRDDG